MVLMQALPLHVMLSEAKHLGIYTKETAGILRCAQDDRVGGCQVSAQDDSLAG